MKMVGRLLFDIVLSDIQIISKCALNKLRNNFSSFM